MSRCVAFIAAVSVLWHTTAGCCAHHAHEEILGYLGVELTGHAPASTQAVHHDCQCDHGTPDAPCSSECEGDECAFAVSTARLSLEFDAPASGPFLDNSVLEAQASFSPSASADAVAARVPRLSGALSRLLALGVLLL